MAPGTAAPEESVTVPRMVAVVACPARGILPAPARNIANKGQRETMRILELVGIGDFLPSSPSGSNIRHTVSKPFLLLGTRAKARDWIWGRRVLPATTFGQAGSKCSRGL